VSTSLEEDSEALASFFSGERAAEELQARHPRIVVVHTPTYASWLNQIEVRRTQNWFFVPS
jgi:hypothetical protein